MFNFTERKLKIGELVGYIIYALIFIYALFFEPNKKQADTIILLFGCLFVVNHLLIFWLLKHKKIEDKLDDISKQQEELKKIILSKHSAQNKR